MEEEAYYLLNSIPYTGQVCFLSLRQLHQTKHHFVRRNGFTKI
jgi:hypothetical protein